MKIDQWHPGKIGILWLGLGLLYLILRSSFRERWGIRGILGMEGEAFFLFLLGFLVVSWFTWKWLSTREP